MSNRRFGCLVALLFFGIGAGAFIWTARNWSRGFDLGRKPPSAAFQQIFQIPPPPGIKNLKVVGYAAMSGEALMTFQADDLEKVVSVLKANPRKPLYGPAPEKVQADLYIEQAERSPYRTKLVWPDRTRLASLPAYGLQNHGDSGWAGVVLIDRPKGQAFVIAELY